MELISADNKELLQTWCQLDDCAQPPCSLLAATFGDLRFGIIFIFSSKIKTFVGGDGLNSSLGSPTRNSFKFFF
jgi:hypothetical protein